MTKYIFILSVLFCSCYSASFSQTLKVIVEGKDLLVPQIYSINQNDTTLVSSINDSIFHLKEDYVGKKLLIKVGSVDMYIGLLDKRAQSIKITYNSIAKEGCVIVSKTYGDVIQSNLDENLSKCLEFHEVKIYSTKNPSKNSEPIKIRKGD